MLHMYTSNAFMAEVSRVCSDAGTEKAQLAELKAFASKLPERAPPPNGGRWWAVEVRHENFKYAMGDESIRKHDRGEDLYKLFEKDKVPKIAHRRRPAPPQRHPF